MRNKKLLSLLVSAILFLAIFFVFFLFLPREPLGGRGVFVVVKESSPEDITSKLYSQGFIRSPFIFSLFWKDKTNISPGGYTLSRGMTYWQVAKVFRDEPSDVWILIPEGLRKEETAEILNRKLNWSVNSKEEFLQDSREGYMFPDTYLLPRDFSGKEAAKKMLRNYEEKIFSLSAEILKKNISQDKLITLASLVQREAANSEEMPFIASVLWNRLSAGYPLQIDAALQYAIGKPGNFWPKITKEDYHSIKSPYNTYLNRGEPPFPICSPGLLAIKAVLSPQKTSYLFYFHDNNGKVYFSDTFQEHSRKIRQFLKK